MNIYTKDLKMNMKFQDLATQVNATQFIHFFSKNGKFIFEAVTFR